MSLLNKMLQDLDQRRAAGHEHKSLPTEVRPLPSPKQTGLPLWVAAGVVTVALAVVAAGVVWWAPWKTVRPPLPAPLPVAAVTPPPAPTPAPAPASAPVQVQVPPSPAPVSTPAPVVSVAAPANAKDAAKPDSGIRPIRPQAPATSPLPVQSAQQRAPRPVVPAQAVASAMPRPEGSAARIEKTPALSQLQNQADAEYRRAQTLLGQGAAADAEAALYQALRLVPEHAMARQALFGLMMEQRRSDEARAVLEEGLRILPGHITWAMNLARLHMEKNSPAAAWEALQRSLPMAASNGDYQAFCGNVLQRLNRSAEAIGYFHSALRINPAEGRWWLGLGLALESSGHPAEAREAFSRAKAVGTLPADLAAYADQKSRQ